MIRLVKPAAEHRQQVLAYKQEFLDCGDSMDGTSELRNCATYEAWLSRLSDNSLEETVRPGLVPETLYLALDEAGGLVGMIDIRHRLNAYLEQFGGHIGYSVRRSERRKGYAIQMLALALEACKAIGIDRCLVTCDKGNVASAKTILHNGGVFESEAEDDGKAVRRYWIDVR